MNGLGLLNDGALVQEFLAGKEYVIDKVRPPACTDRHIYVYIDRHIYVYVYINNLSIRALSLSHLACS